MQLHISYNSNMDSNTLSGKLSPILEKYNLEWSSVTKSMRNVVDDSYINLARRTSFLSFSDLRFERVAVEMMHLHIQEQAPKTFAELAEKLKPVLSEAVYRTYAENSSRLDTMIVPERDLKLTYAGISTLWASYGLMGIESPQQIFARMAVALHTKMEKGALIIDWGNVYSSYNLYSNLYAIHSSSTIFALGTKDEYLSSCFLMSFDRGCNIQQVIDMQNKMSKVMLRSGGVGVSIASLPGDGAPDTYLKSGHWDKSHKYVQLFDSLMTSLTTHGHRRSSIAIYQEPWNCDILELLECFKFSNLLAGREDTLLKRVFFAVYVTESFMECVNNEEPWYLFNPADVPDLPQLYGDDFKARYKEYVADESIPRNVVNAFDILKTIMSIQVGRGFPYIINKDACNRLSTHNYLGTIKCSNLCTEIVQYADYEHPSVCSLGCVSLTKFVEHNEFDFRGFGVAVRQMVQNVTMAMEKSSYALDSCRHSVDTLRPIAVGVQGLSDVFQMLNMPYTSERARQLNVDIFGYMYYSAMCETVEMAERAGCFNEISKVLEFHHDLFYNQYEKVFVEKRSKPMKKCQSVTQEQWDTLRDAKSKHGMYNSLLIGLMPTSMSSHLMGNSPSFEPPIKNIFKKRLDTGEYVMYSSHFEMALIKKFGESGVNAIKTKVLQDRGSVANVEELDENTRDVFKTASEVDRVGYMEMALERQPFIDQSQSLNYYMEATDANADEMCDIYIDSAMCGMKTIVYYLQAHAAEKEKRPLDEGEAEPQSCKRFASSDPSSEACTSCST